MENNQNKMIIRIDLDEVVRIVKVNSDKKASDILRLKTGFPFKERSVTTIRKQLNIKKLQRDLINHIKQLKDF